MDAMLNLGPAVPSSNNSSSVATNRAPCVTVFTNIAGAVSVTVDQAGIDAGRRLRSAVLPQNTFTPFHNYKRKQRNAPPPKDFDDDPAQQHPQVVSAAAAALAVQDLKIGVREALDRWALQT